MCFFRQIQTAPKTTKTQHLVGGLVDLIGCCELLFAFLYQAGSWFIATHPYTNTYTRTHTLSTLNPEAVLSKLRLKKGQKLLPFFFCVFFLVFSCLPRLKVVEVITAHHDFHTGMVRSCVHPCLSACDCVPPQSSPWLTSRSHLSHLSHLPSTLQQKPLRFKCCYGQENRCAPTRAREGWGRVGLSIYLSFISLTAGFVLCSFLWVGTSSWMSLYCWMR